MSEERIWFVGRLFFRVALAATFLSAVADRFGIWGPPGTPGVSWGTWEAFLRPVAELNSFLPAALIPAAAWIATLAEVVLAVFLLLDLRPWLTGIASAVLLTIFGLTMTFAWGAQAPLKFSVWVDAAGAFLFAVTAPSRGFD